MLDDRFFGRTGREWADIGQVMEERKLKTAGDLRSALSIPEQMVEVRDAKNRERLLGFLPREMFGPRFTDRGDRLGIAVMPPCPVGPSKTFSHLAMDRLDTHTIQLSIGYRETDSGWSRTVEFTTEAPLGVLLWLREFRLPGESRDEAEERAYRTRYRGR